MSRQRKKHTRIAPPRKRQLHPHDFVNASDFALVSIATEPQDPNENPDWLVGSD